MVNEINKPPPEISANAALEERLANSNRQLAEMQEEHLQLVQEMEMLRQRAAELSLRNAQQSTRVPSASPAREPAPATIENVPVAAPIESAPVAAPISTPDEDKISAAVPSGEASTTKQDAQDGQDDEEDPEAAEYIRQKLAEVANLKAQLRRVQNIVNTTNLIEERMGKQVLTSTESEHSGLPTTATAAADPPAPAVPRTGTGDVRAELLTDMLSMFNDFTSDLRGQADSLRAERERIKELKEELLGRRRGNE